MVVTCLAIIRHLFDINVISSASKRVLVLIKEKVLKNAGNRLPSGFLGTIYSFGVTWAPLTTKKMCFFENHLSTSLCLLNSKIALLNGFVYFFL